jgi:hypothetical protein
METRTPNTLAVPSLGRFSGFIGSICHFADRRIWRFGTGMES